MDTSGSVGSLVSGLEGWGVGAPRPLVPASSKKALPPSQRRSPNSVFKKGDPVECYCCKHGWSHLQDRCSHHWGRGPAPGGSSTPRSPLSAAEGEPGNSWARVTCPAATPLATLLTTCPHASGGGPARGLHQRPSELPAGPPSPERGGADPPPLAPCLGTAPPPPPPDAWRAGQAASTTRSRLAHPRCSLSFCPRRRTATRRCRRGCPST